MPAATTLVLDERLRMTDVMTLHSTLRALLDTGAPVQIDGSRVKEVDSASLQLLASLWRSSASRNIECSWLQVSEPLRRAARLSGVLELLSMPRPTQ